MTPQFAAALDPIFLYVLQLLQRISEGQSVDIDAERDRIENRFREAETHLSGKQGWELAKYALVAWIDEVLIEAPWEGSEKWQENLLEFAYFQTRNRATMFYQKAAEAAKLSRRDALEVFYVCTALGFRGLYDTSEATFLAESLKEPHDIDEWAKKYRRKIQLGHGRPSITESMRPVKEAEPLEGKFIFVSTLLVSIILVAFVIVIGYFVIFEK